MELINNTPFAVHLARTQTLYRDLMMAIVVIKASYEITPEGVPQQAQEQLPVSEEDVTTALGSIDGDVAPVKQGCDLVVLGHAHTPSGRPARQHRVEVRLGSWRRQLLVLGDRVWCKRGGLLVASEPEPFVQMPLTYDRAFGGVASAGPFETAHSDNPHGIGYVHLPEQAEGKPLPNLEELDQRITRWSDRPLPAGVAPLPRHSAMRVARGARADVEEGVTRVLPGLFSMAHPRMLLDEYPARQRLDLEGMRPEGAWGFALPDLPVWLDVALGERVAQLPAAVDTLCVFPDYARFFLVARRAFIYRILPRRQRNITVRTGALPPATRLETLATLATAATSLRGTSVPSVLEPAATNSIVPFELLRELNPMTEIVESLPLCPSG